MARTAPTVDGSGNVRNLSIRMIDVSGDKRAVAFELGLAVTAAEIEAFVAAYAAVTNALVYAVHDTQLYTSPAIASGAVAAEENSVFDNIVILAKSNTNESDELFIPAPERTLFVGDTDNPDAAALAALIALWEPLLSGTKVAVSARFTERREKNQTVPL